MSQTHFSQLKDLHLLSELERKMVCLSINGSMERDPKVKFLLD